MGAAREEGRLTVDFDFSAAQYELRDEARRFLAKECTTDHVREFIDDPSGWSRGLWKQIADLGWMALPFPEEFGGLGQGFLDLVLLLEELGAAVAPVPFLSSVVLSGYPILRHGSDEQKQRWLPDIASGDRVAAAVLPFFEHDVDTIPIRADGNRLTGDRSHVLDAPAADLLVVAAGDGETHRWFVVEEGFEVRPQQAYDRTRPLGAVTLDGVEATPLEIPIQHRFRYFVVAVCAEMLGVAQRLLDMTVQYAKEREQFGRPIGGFQLTQAKLADMAVELHKGILLAHHLGRRMDAGRLRPEQVSFGKLNNVREAIEICRTARTILGANGISLEYPVMRHATNLESVLTYEGTVEMHQLVLGKALTGLDAFR